MLIKKTRTNKAFNCRLDTLQQDHPYLIKELGLNQETIADFSIGYCADKRKANVGRIIIPIHNARGALVAYAKHRLGEVDGSGSPRCEFSIGFKKSLELFNLDRATKEVTARPLIVVRNLFEVLHLHQNGYRNAVALMGDFMSQTQEALIRHNSDGHARILLLPNLNQSKWSRIAIRLSQFCYVKYNVLEKPKAQPGELTRKQIMELF